MEENPKANHLGCLKPLQNNVRKTTFHLSAGCLGFLPSTVSFVGWTMRVFQKKHLKVRETPFPYQEHDNSSDEKTHTFRLTSTLPKKTERKFPFSPLPSNLTWKKPTQPTQVPRLQLLWGASVSSSFLFAWSSSRTVLELSRIKVIKMFLEFTDVPGFHQVFLKGLVGFASFSLL